MLDAQLTEYAIKGLEAELAALDAQRATLQEQLQTLRKGTNGRVLKRTATTVTAPPRKTKKAKRPVMSDAGRQRIAEAQRRRWAASRAEATPAAPTAKKTAPAASKPAPKATAKGKADAGRTARLEALAKARQAKAAKKAPAPAAAAPEREIARPPMPRHVRKQGTPQQPAQAQA